MPSSPLASGTVGGLLCFNTASLREDKMQNHNELRVAFLTPDSAEAVFALHQRVAAQTPHGYLALRSLEEFRSILSEEARSMSVGAWVGDCLIGYSLCNLETASSEGATPIMRLLAESAKPVWWGKGLAVDPDFRGRNAAGLLVGMQSKELRALNIVHTIAHFATANFVSVKGGIRSGVWLIDIERDAYCDNFVGYGGSLQQRFDIEARRDMPIDDLFALRQAFQDGWVGVEADQGETGVTTITLGRLVSAAEPDRPMGYREASS